MVNTVIEGLGEAWLVAIGYFAAVLTGMALGAWSAGWDIAGATACMSELYYSGLGLRKLRGLLCFFALFMTTTLYFKLDRFQWDTACASAFLWTFYTYVALGAGKAQPSVVIFPLPAVPEWRIYASLAAIVAIHVLVRLAGYVRVRESRPSRQ